MYRKLLNASFAPYTLGMLRIIAAASFFTHGTMKIFSWPGPFQHQMSSLVYVAGLMEVAGGIMLAIGWLARPTAFVLSGLMAFAYFLAHAPQNFFPVLNGGELSVLYCFIFLHIAAAGPGSWSVDAYLQHRSQPRTE
jgi:putative oxidoreductase